MDSVSDEILQRHHVFVATDNPFQRRARLLQAMWREERGLPLGDRARKTLLHALWPGRVAEVTKVAFGYSPGRGSPKFTADRTAFDVYVEHTTSGGGRGFIGIEVKYHEALTDAPAEHRPRSDEVTRAMRCFKPDLVGGLRRKPRETWDRPARPRLRGLALRARALAARARARRRTRGCPGKSASRGRHVGCSMRLSMKTSSLALLLALGPLTACAVDSAPPANDPVEATQASAIVGGAGTVGDVGDLPAEVDPSRTGPYAQGKLVRITSSELDYVLVNALVGTRLVLDTTGTSPTVVAPFYSCTYPNKRIREALTADCMERLGSDRVQCLKEMNAEYPNITQCGQSGAHFHSYIDFGSVAEAAGAQDIGFEDFRTITRDSAGPGSITVDINYVRTMVGVGTTQAWFSPEPGNKAAANISLTLDSNQPTIPCTHSVLGCPDIELTNMKIVASLSGIKPVYEDTSKLGFDTVGATFTFDRNLNNVPDGLATALVDVDAIIKNNVEANVKRALGFAASRSALNKALTELAVRKAKEKNGSIGIDRFYAAWPEGKDTIVVDYQPCPRMGCGIGGPGSPIKETTKKLTP